MYSPTKRDLMFKNIWMCALRRAYEYKNTPRGEREMETVKMCLSTAKWEIFEEDRRTILTPSQALVATEDELWCNINNG